MAAYLPLPFLLIPLSLSSSFSFPSSLLLFLLSFLFFQKPAKTYKIQWEKTKQRPTGWGYRCPLPREIGGRETGQRGRCQGHRCWPRRCYGKYIRVRQVVQMTNTDSCSSIIMYIDWIIDRDWLQSTSMFFIFLFVSLNDIDLVHHLLFLFFASSFHWLPTHFISFFILFLSYLLPSIFSVPFRDPLIPWCQWLSQLKVS